MFPCGANPCRSNIKEKKGGELAERRRGKRGAKKYPLYIRKNLGGEKEKVKQMKQTRKSLRKDKKGFTGLEAAIVLTAFIVVAAVFSYMVLGAGFFSTEKAKAVVHTGVEQTTSSCELAGDVIGEGNTTPATDILENVTLYLELTAGENPLDMDKMTVSYTDKYVYVANLTRNATTDAEHRNITVTQGQWDYAFVKNQADSRGDDDNMLDANEKVKMFIWLPAEAGNSAGGVISYDWLQLEVKPEQGGTLPVKKTVPGSIDDIMILY